MSLLRFALPCLLSLKRLLPNARTSLWSKVKLNPIFQGVYSSRIEIKQWYRSLESLLTTAEN